MSYDCRFKTAKRICAENSLARFERLQFTRQRGLVENAGCGLRVAGSFLRVAGSFLRVVFCG